MIQSIVRYFIASALAYMVGHGVITQSIANANTAAITNYAVAILSVAGLVLWSYLEKKYKGVLNVYFPSGNSSGSSSPTGRLSLLVLAPLAAGMSLVIACSCLTGCATPQTATTSQAQTLINDAWSAANQLQQSNNGQLITPAAQSAVLNLTHNSGDAAYASMATGLLNQVVGAIVASQAAKVNPVPAVNAVLAPANVAALATSVANGSPTTTTATVAPSSTSASVPTAQPITSGTTSL